jgi:hypothetical protein
MNLDMAKKPLDPKRKKFLNQPIAKTSLFNGAGFRRWSSELVHRERAYPS